MTENLTKEQIRDELRERMVPILLSHSPKAHLVAWRLFGKYGVVSFLCGTKKSFWLRLDPVCRFLRLNRRENRLAAEQLADFVEAFGDCLFFLLPITAADNSFLSEYAPFLESRLIVTDAKALLSEIPFASRH